MAKWVCTNIDCRIDHQTGKAITNVEFSDEGQMKKFAKAVKKKKRDARLDDPYTPQNNRAHFNLQLLGNEAAAFEVGQAYQMVDIEAWL